MGERRLQAKDTPFPVTFERCGWWAHFQLPTSSEICVAGFPSSWGAHAMEYWRAESGKRILHRAEGLSGSAVSMPLMAVASRAGLKSFANRMRSQNSSWAWGNKRRGVKRNSYCGLALEVLSRAVSHWPVNLGHLEHSPTASNALTMSLQYNLSWLLTNPTSQSLAICPSLVETKRMHFLGVLEYKSKGDSTPAFSRKLRKSRPAANCSLIKGNVVIQAKSDGSYRGKCGRRGLFSLRDGGPAPSAVQRRGRAP
jgi:hypothetical protein